jgi:hypothetical protein
MCGEEVASELMDGWLGQACHIPKSMLVGDTAIIPRLQEYANGRVAEIAGFPEQKHITIQWKKSILREAEMLYARSRTHTGIQWQNVMRTMTARRRSACWSGYHEPYDRRVLSCVWLLGARRRCRPKPSIL